MMPGQMAGHGDPETGHMWSELARLKSLTPMYDAVIEEIDGRRIRIGDHWLADFASCNYLGFDLDPQIMAAADEQIHRWGTHPSWSRLLGSPRLYPQIEERLTDLLGAQDTLVLPTITHIHLSVIPALTENGTVFCERQAHRTIYDGCRAARGQGARLMRWDAEDLEGSGAAAADAARVPAGHASARVHGRHQQHDR
jgi:8-amino-7-oxononanoate synthase